MTKKNTIMNCIHGIPVVQMCAHCDGGGVPIENKFKHPGALHHSIEKWLNETGFTFRAFDHERKTERYSKRINDTGQHIWWDYWELEFYLKTGEIRITYQKAQLNGRGWGWGQQTTASVQELIQERWDVDKFFNMHMTQLRNDVERTMFKQMAGEE